MKISAKKSDNSREISAKNSQNNSANSRNNSKNARKFHILLPDGVYPEMHEIATAQVLVRRGDVEFLIPNRTKGAKTADIFWQNLDWEMKAPIGRGKRVIINAVRSALKQSKNIILDLRYQKKSANMVDYLKNHAEISRGVKYLKVIVKEGIDEKVVDIK